MNKYYIKKVNGHGKSVVSEAYIERDGFIYALHKTGIEVKNVNLKDYRKVDAKTFKRETNFYIPLFLMEN